MSLKIDMYISVADPAAPHPPAPPRSPSLFLDQTEARREYLRVWMTAPTPPPPYLRVWMTGGPPYLKVWIQRCILLLPTFLLFEIPHSLSCLASRRRPYFSFLGSLRNSVFERRTSTGSGLFTSVSSGLVETLV